MSYATESDLLAWCGMQGEVELTELTDPTNTAIDSLIVADKLIQADNEINSRLAGIVIGDPFPAIIVNIACRIARFLLYTTGRPDWVTADFDWAIATLNDIRNGKVIITPILTPVSSIAVASSTPVFADSFLGAM